jgi:hypothetical protein
MYSVSLVIHQHPLGVLIALRAFYAMGYALARFLEFKKETIFYCSKLNFIAY